MQQTSETTIPQPEPNFEAQPDQPDATKTASVRVEGGEFWKKVRKYCIDNGMTAREFTEAALRDRLKALEGALRRAE
jgi:hypothetical protein